MLKYSGVPGWLVFGGATLVAAILSGGLIWLLLVGRTVPTELWVLEGVIGTAYFGAGPFSAAMQHSSTTAAQLLDTVNHSVEVLRATTAAALASPATSTTTSDGVTTNAGATGPQGS